jgi:hypothetical protein
VILVGYIILILHFKIIFKNNILFNSYIIASCNILFKSTNIIFNDKLFNKIIIKGKVAIGKARYLLNIVFNTWWFKSTLFRK